MQIFLTNLIVDETAATEIKIVFSLICVLAIVFMGRFIFALIKEHYSVRRKFENQHDAPPVAVANNQMRGILPLPKLVGENCEIATGGLAASLRLEYEFVDSPRDTISTFRSKAVPANKRTKTSGLWA